MDNKEDILDALNEFSRQPSSKIPPLLDQYLRKIAKSGETIFPWNKIRPLFVAKLECCMEEFHEQAPTDKLPPCPNVENICYNEMKSRLLKAVNNFNNAPFTIQRLCELITEPQKHYKRTDKFLRGIEKNIMVVSCVDSCGTKIVNEGKSFLNGLDTNGEMKTPGKKSSFNFLRLFAPPPPPANSPTAANAESRLAESTSPTALSPVSVWPLASRFISNNGEGPWPQVSPAAASAASSAASSAALDEIPTANSESDRPGESGELSSTSRLQIGEGSSSSEEKKMEVEQMPCSSERIPSTTTDVEKPSTSEIGPDKTTINDATSTSAEASSSEPMSSVDEESSNPTAAETKAEATESKQSAELADDKVSSSDLKPEEAGDTRVLHREAAESSEAKNVEKPGSPLDKEVAEVSQSIETNMSDSVSAESHSDIVTESTSRESVGRTVGTSSQVSAPSPPCSESVSSSESSQSEVSEDSPLPSSTSSKEESKDSPSQSDDQSSSSSSLLSDSAKPSEAPCEEAMEQD